MAHTPQTTTNTEAVGPSWPDKTKKAGHETIEVVRELTCEMTKLRNLMAIARDHIGILVSYFKHESEAVNRRMTVASKVMKM